MPWFVNLALSLLRYLPLGQKIAAIVPTLASIAAAAGAIIEQLGKLAAAFIEGILEALNHPKVLMVIAAAFVYGTVYSSDKHSQALAAARAARCECAVAKKIAPPRPSPSQPSFSIDGLFRWLK